LRGRSTAERSPGLESSEGRGDSRDDGERREGPLTAAPLASRELPIASAPGCPWGTSIVGQEGPRALAGPGSFPPLSEVWVSWRGAG
jgi:hypothetical protein